MNEHLKPLLTRSHQDTSQTQAEIQKNYATFTLSCPGMASLVPQPSEK